MAFLSCAVPIVGAARCRADGVARAAEAGPCARRVSIVVSWRDLVSVAVGGALGTAARAGLTLAFADALGPVLVPIINVIGAFAIGILFGIRARMPRSPRAQRAQLFFGTGVLGGFTTYSALAVESADLSSVWWGVATVVIGTLAAWAGVVIGRGRRAP